MLILSATCANTRKPFVLNAMTTRSSIKMIANKSGMTKSEKIILPSFKLPVTELKGVGDTIAEKFEQLNIKTVADLLFHLPSGFVDRTKKQFVTDVEHGKYITVELAVQKVYSGAKTAPNRVYCEDLKGNKITINHFCGSSSWAVREWMNLKSNAYIVGGTVIVSGKLYRYQKTQEVINNPDFVIPVRSLEDLQKANSK